MPLLSTPRLARRQPPPQIPSGCSCAADHKITMSTLYHPAALKAASEKYDCHRRQSHMPCAADYMSALWQGKILQPGNWAAPSGCQDPGSGIQRPQLQVYSLLLHPIHVTTKRPARYSAKGREHAPELLAALCVCNCIVHLGQLLARCRRRC